MIAIKVKANKHHLQKFKTTSKFGTYLCVGLSCDFSDNLYIICAYDNDPIMRDLLWGLGQYGKISLSQ